jgi:cytochrome c biogenesis protein CcmG, thiol:disulfide interchange protein DsbE
VSLRISSLIAVALLVAAPLARAAPPPALEPVAGRVIWVDFWASWCVPCRRSFPWLNSMHRKYGPAGLQIIAVNLDKDRALADAFLAEVPAEFALRFDPSAALAKQFGVQAMPSSFLIDSAGNVLESHFGFKTAEAADYERAIEAALERLTAKQ